MGVAERSAKSGAAIKLLAYGGVPTSTDAVRARTYLLSRPLILVTRSTPTGSQKRLIDYAVSEAVTDLYLVVRQRLPGRLAPVTIHAGARVSSAVLELGGARTASARRRLLLPAGW